MSTTVQDARVTRRQMLTGTERVTLANPGRLADAAVFITGVDANGVGWQKVGVDTWVATEFGEVSEVDASTLMTFPLTAWF